MGWFFDAQDWFGRTGSFYFSLEHIIFIIVATILCLIIPLMLKNKSRNSIRTFLICIWGIVVLYDILKWSSWWYTVFKDGERFIDKIGSHLPLHTCSMFMYVAPLAFFPRNKTIKTAAMNFLCTINLVVGYMSLYLSSAMMSYYSVFSFNGLHTLLYHTLITLVPMVMLITGYYKPKWKDIWKGFTLFLIIAAVVFTIDNIFKIDYMYLYDQKSLGIFNFIADLLPHRLIWTVVALAGYFGMAAISLGIILLFRKISDKHKFKKEITRP